MNISPIFASHLVFIPRAPENHPQYLGSVDLLADGLGLFKNFTVPGSALVGFNSIGGFSTINHLHYQLFDVRALKLTKPIAEDELRQMEEVKYYT